MTSAAVRNAAYLFFFLNGDTTACVIYIIKDDTFRAIGSKLSSLPSSTLLMYLCLDDVVNFEVTITFFGFARFRFSERELLGYFSWRYCEAYGEGMATIISGK